MDLSNHDQFWIPEDEPVGLRRNGSGSAGSAEDVAETLRHALASAGAGVWELDLLTETVRMSPHSLSMYGLPETHSGAMPYQEFLQVIDFLDFTPDQLEAPLRSFDVPRPPQQYRIRRPDGEIRWLRLSGGFAPTHGDGPAKIVGLQFDVTVQQRAQDMAHEQAEQLRLIQKAVHIGTSVTDADRNTSGSDQFYKNLGLPEDTGPMDVETYMGLIHSDDRERVSRAIAAAIESRDLLDFEYRIHRADTGELRWILARTKYERAENGRLFRIVGAHLDITETKHAEARLRETVAFNQSILDASADCVKLIDLDGQLLFMNQPGLVALEVDDASAIIGKNWAELWPQAERPKAEAALQAARDGQTGRLDGGCPTAKGSPRWWDVVVTPICDEWGRPQQLLAISRDVTEHRENMAKIQWTASHDMLTELPNRRYFQDRLRKQLDRAAAHDRPLALLQLDVDDFKLTNDTLGHDAGDALLKEFTQRLLNATRKSELVARLGGDEFAIIVPDLTTERSLTEVLANIRQHLARPFIYHDRVWDCQAGIGIAVYPQNGKTADELLKNADVALYMAKAAGRGQVRGYDPVMRVELLKRLDMINAARAALRDDRIVPYYQPKIRLDNGATAGFEALLRWQDIDGTTQSPSSIAAAFDDLDVAQALSERMQLRVLADMRRWLDDGINFGHIAINASAAEFRQNDFAERFLDRIYAAGVPADLVELEVTETVFLGRGAEDVERALKLLSTAGVSIALDDFGTGYASLTHLKRFPVDILKIDQSFIRNVETDPDDAAIVAALIQLGKSLSIGVVAEGIETQAQYAFLAAQGCDIGQGYLFSQAIAAPKVPSLLSRIKAGEHLAEVSPSATPEMSISKLLR